MAREKGMGNLQCEKSGRWTMRVSIKGVRYCRSTRTKDRVKAERIYCSGFSLRSAVENGECGLRNTSSRPLLS